MAKRICSAGPCAPLGGVGWGKTSRHGLGAANLPAELAKDTARVLQAARSFLANGRIRPGQSLNSTAPYYHPYGLPPCSPQGRWSWQTDQEVESPIPLTYRVFEKDWG